MSQEIVEIVRRMSESFNEAGYSAKATLDFFDADAVFEEPPEQPAPRIARGRDEIVEIFGQFDEAWEEHRSDYEEIRAIDDARVLLLSIEHFRGRDGMEIDQPCGTIFTFRNGKVVRMQSFWERENALEAAGLRE
jgi:ketosteroid isomerase-like protein